MIAGIVADVSCLWAGANCCVQSLWQCQNKCTSSLHNDDLVTSAHWSAVAWRGSWCNSSQRSTNGSQLRSEQSLYYWCRWSCHVLISAWPDLGETNRRTDAQRQQGRYISNRLDFRCIQHTRRRPASHLADLPFHSRCSGRKEGKHQALPLSAQPFVTRQVDGVGVSVGVSSTKAYQCDGFAPSINRAFGACDSQICTKSQKPSTSVCVCR